MAISDLQPNSNATLETVEVLEKGDVREFSRYGKLGRVATCKIKDDSGECDLTLWNEDVDKYATGDKLKLTDMWVKEWNGRIQISTGKNGSIEKLST